MIKNISVKLVNGVGIKLFRIPIREDEIKAMKDFKRDILEITPKIKGEDDTEFDSENIKEKPFEEIFREFYKKERDVEAEKEVVDLLLSIISEEGDGDETN